MASNVNIMYASDICVYTYGLTSIRGPSDCKILMTITIGMQIMEARAKHQPRPMAQSGYSYTLL